MSNRFRHSEDPAPAPPTIRTCKAVRRLALVEGMSMTRVVGRESPLGQPSAGGHSPGRITSLSTSNRIECGRTRTQTSRT